MEICFTVVRFLGNGGHLELYGIHQSAYNFNSASSNAVKRFIHTEDI